MIYKYNTLPSVVLGFHSCDKETGLKIINGEEHLKPSTNDYDWLGHGIYFWEQNPSRALQYAEEVKSGKQRAKGLIKTPFVIGAIIDLGNCLNLTESNSFIFLREAYKSLRLTYEKSGIDLPKNIKGARMLDFAVIMHVHKLWELRGFPSYDSVRGAFPEGAAIYDGAMIQDRTHIQICLLSHKSILGYFLPLPAKDAKECA